MRVLYFAGAGEESDISLSPSEDHGLLQKRGVGKNGRPGGQKVAGLYGTILGAKPPPSSGQLGSHAKDHRGWALLAVDNPL